MTKAKGALDDWETVGSYECWADWALKHQDTIAKALELLEKVELGGVDVTTIKHEGAFLSYKDLEKYILIERE